VDVDDVDTDDSDVDSGLNEVKREK